MAASNTVRQAIPLADRKFDVVFVAFFVVNLVFVTYMIDVEQTIISNPYDFDYPAWPPKPIIDAVHWWGDNFDPLLMQRPMFWKMTIWIDTVFFGPFYLLAIYAFLRGRDWIKNWTLLYSATMMTNVTIILGEEVSGAHASSSLPIVLLANGSWFLVPLMLIVRVWPEHPFTRLSQPSPSPSVRTLPGESG